MDKEKSIYLSQIRIEKLFGESSITWDLCNDINILGGINGSGKSTIFKCVYFLLMKGKLPEYMKDICESIELNFSNGYSAKWKTEEDRIAHQDSGDNMKFAIRLTIHDFIQYFLSWQQINFLETLEHEIISKEVAEKIGNENIRTNLDLAIYQQIVKRNALLAEYFEKASASGSIDQSLRKMTDIYQVLNSFFKSTHKEATNSNKFEFKCPNRTISWYQLSSGEKQLLLVLLTVFNTENHPGIFIMDEPDLGMHIEWKEIFIKQIHAINPNLQLIISTHAPSMIKGWYGHVKEMSQLTVNPKQ